MWYDYKEEIKSNEWQRKSGHIKELRNYTCQYSGKNDKLVHVHHTYYEKGLHYWEYPDESLIVLCEDCHKEAHNLISDDKNGVDNVTYELAKKNAEKKALNINDGYYDRWMLKFMFESPFVNRYLEESHINCGKTISMDEFNLLYEMNQAFLQNVNKNREILISLGEGRLGELFDSLKLRWITKKGFIEKLYACNNIPRFDFVNDYTISVSYDSNSTRFNYVLKKVNNVIGTDFFISPIKYGFSSNIVIPLEMLIIYKDEHFEFSEEAFKNGKIKTFSIPNTFQSLEYYIDKLKSISRIKG